MLLRAPAPRAPHSSLRALRSLVIALAVSAAAISASAQLIDTTTGGFESVGLFGGKFATSTYGQTFQAPSAVYSGLTSFTFYLRSFNDDPVDFNGYLAQWDPTTDSVTGPLLYSSPEEILAGGTVHFEAFTFSFPQINLNPAAEYVAFLSAVNYPTTGAALVGFVGSNDYDGGEFVHSDAEHLGNLGTAGWNSFFGYDLDFKATFVDPPAASPVPEPSTYGLIAAAVLAGTIAGRQRRAPALARV